MDFNKIFIKDARPTKIGGQAVLEGIMMKGEDRTAVVVRLPDGRMHIKTDMLNPQGKASVAAKMPVIRGIVNFVQMLMLGMRTLMYSAELLEEYAEPEPGTDSGNDAKDEGSGLSFGAMIVIAVILAIIFVVGIFIIVPTVVINFAETYIESSIVLNLLEGVFRILLFVVYIALVSNMKDMRTTFEYHGAEHKTIHCYENELELTPANCQSFPTLHPRCGTSFLMFVMIIALLLFSLLGWPNLLFRIASRIVLIPLIAGLSYELLRYAGRTDNLATRIFSVPGLLLQKLTTREPDDKQIEAAIAALSAVLVPAETAVIDGFCGADGALLPPEPEPESEPEPEFETEDDEEEILLAACAKKDIQWA